MKKTDKFKKVLFEEIDNFVNQIEFSGVENNKKILNELFAFNYNTFMKDMGSQEIEKDTEIGSEMWDWLIQTINESVKQAPDAWLKIFKEQKLKTLCYKYFTKNEPIGKEKLETYLKKNIRMYFTALQNYSDLDGFRNKVENLPSILLSNLIRFLLLFSEELKKEVKVSKDEFKKEIELLLKERFKFIEKLDMISKKYQSNIDLTMLKKLVDNGLFYEDTVLNRAVGEYVFKLLDHKDAVKNIREYYTNTFVADLKDQIQDSESFMRYTERVKNNEDINFFTEKGKQVGNRLSLQIEIIKDKKFDESIIKKDSRVNEPIDTIKSVPSPLEYPEEGGEENQDNSDGFGGGASGTTGSGGGSPDGGSGGGGGSFGGGGGVDFGTDTSDINPEFDEDGNEISGTGGEDGGTGEPGETELPTDEDGLPVDFGSEETNPEAAQKADTETQEKSNEITNNQGSEDNNQENKK